MKVKFFSALSFYFSFNCATRCGEYHTADDENLWRAVLVVAYSQNAAQISRAQVRDTKGDAMKTCSWCNKKFIYIAFKEEFYF